MTRSTTLVLIGICLVYPTASRNISTTISFRTSSSVAKTTKKIANAGQSNIAVRDTNPAQEFKEILVLDDIIQRRKLPQPFAPVTDVWLDISLPVEEVGPIDCDAHYECTGANFTLKKIDSSQWSTFKDKLDTLSKLPISECYATQNDYENHQMQPRCRFVRKMKFESNNFQKEAETLLRKWAPDLNGEKILAIWIEGGVRVDSKGLPLIKLHGTRPIALITDHGTYVVVERVNPTAEFAHQIVVAGHRAFSFTNTNDLKKSTINVMNIFSDELEKSFKDNPLLAERSFDSNQMDGELIIKRVRQKSRVIGRESIFNGISPSLANFFNSAFEISTYTILWNSADSKNFTSTIAHGFFGKGAKITFGSNVFIQLENELLISSDGISAYRENIEPADQMNQFLAIYKKAVTQAYVKSLKNTCRRLSGKGIYIGGTCEVRGDIQ